ncbi:D-alanine--D-alanine ligase family protein [Phorcysia thermohydrogeniphila]|uniref:D-alanine--D-alanine ligase n=1 Tax=Phorcysia thermohydrogeniphila TaxID=936138 RepID=A0A4R1GGZ9_9BACT|nr:D-alanine--D-alanine ligase [Phorcysia thermohydrogeniphila]TCK06253.1 D-alanine-D-alanine ligase [Phorcysia thermohydrogeniphila]
MKVAVVYGGPSPEADVSRKSAAGVISALKEKGYEVFPLELNDSFIKKLEEIKPDKVFLVLHGCPGEDGTVQGLLEVMGFDYTGCNTQTSAICMDKDITKRVLKTYGIPVPAGETYFSEEEVELLELPCVVKPARTGSSVGINVARTEEEFWKAVKEAFRYDSKILVEEYIEGRELTVGVLNGRALPPVEIITEGGFYDYEAKYVSSKTQYVVPAPLPERISKKLQRISEKVYKILECHGAVRVDFRLDERGAPYLLEVNTIPGMTERSLLPKAAQSAGIEFPELIERILKG